MKTKQEIVEMVEGEIAEALGLPRSEVLGNLLLRRDLGAESIDFIDLTFRYEKALGRPLSEQDIFLSSRPDGDVSVKEVTAALQAMEASASS